VAFFRGRLENDPKTKAYENESETAWHTEIVQVGRWFRLHPGTLGSSALAPAKMRG
jgi:hypothetical protein